MSELQRPLRGLGSMLAGLPRAASHVYPGLRGLALGYMLSPTAWARIDARTFTQGSADLPWATRFRPLRALGSMLAQ